MKWTTYNPVRRTIYRPRQREGRRRNPQFVKVYDISVALHNAALHWPGEAGFQMETSSDGPVCVSRMTMGLHTATHLDAPLHFIPDGKNLDEVPLEQYLGRARVIEIENEREITAEELRTKNLDGCDKLLFKTQNSHKRLDAPEFDRDFIALNAAGARYLMERGVTLIGTDYLSIESFHSDGTVHNILLEKNTVILEGLDLRRVPHDRDYFLICLPLKISGAEASPTRAVLLDQFDG